MRAKRAQVRLLRHSLRAKRPETHCNMTYCNTLQHTATHCNTLQHTAIPEEEEGQKSVSALSAAWSASKTSCNTLQHHSRQHNSTHCNTLQHTATHCNTLQHHRKRRVKRAQVPFLRHGLRARHPRGPCHDAFSFLWLLRFVALCCSVLPCVAVCCSMLQCVAVCCSALHCVAVTHHSVIWHTATRCNHTATHCNKLQQAATSCNMLQHTHLLICVTWLIVTEWVMSHITDTPVSARDVGWWVTSKIWMSHVTLMNESFHTYEWVMSHLWMSHATRNRYACVSTWWGPMGQLRPLRICSKCSRACRCVLCRFGKRAL